MLDSSLSYIVFQFSCALSVDFLLLPRSYSPQFAAFDLSSDDRSLSWVGLAWHFPTSLGVYLKWFCLLSGMRGKSGRDHRFCGAAG